MSKPSPVCIPETGHILKEWEEWCPFYDMEYHLVPGYDDGLGCPCCKSIGPRHLPVAKDEIRNYFRKRKALEKC